MPRLRDLVPVDDGYATAGPNHNLLRWRLRRSAEDVFALLVDGPAAKRWQGIDVEWTSPPPHTVGSTRRVRGLGLTIEQRVLAWEPGTRLCIRSERATLPLAAFAEEYALTSTSARTCELAWHYAYEWAGPAERLLGPLFGTAFALGGRRDLARLARLVESPDSGVA